MHKLAIFDLDGTLLNTLGDLAAACNNALSLMGFPTHPQDAYKLFVGDGVFRLMERMAPEEYRQDSEVLRQLKVHFDEYYRLHGRELTRPYEGILPMLLQWKEQGGRTAVLSNKPHAFTTALVQSYFGSAIDCALGQRDDVPPKPHPAGAKELLRHFDVSAPDVVYAGDSGVDMQLASRAGMVSVGVTWGFRSRQELLENGADHIVDTPQQLLKLMIDK